MSMVGLQMCWIKFCIRYAMHDRGEGGPAEFNLYPMFTDNLHFYKITWTH